MMFLLLLLALAQPRPVSSTAPTTAPAFPEGAEVIAPDATALPFADPLAELPPTPQEVRRFEPEGGGGLDYLLALPAGYDDDPDKPWPVVVFLHGAGERGDNREKIKAWGPPRMLDEGFHLPAIVVSPQCPAETWWPEHIESLSGLLDTVEREHRVDTNRIYLTGLSMGGFGTMAWAGAEPERFAAIVPICGGGTPEAASAVADVPTWIFHGTADPVVPVQNSIDLYRWIKDDDGADVRLTLYEGVGHNSWSPAFADGRLWVWLFEQSHDKK